MPHFNYLLVTLIIVCFIATIYGAPHSSIKRHRNLKNIFPNGKIVGGQQTTIEQVPWQVALEDTGYLFCGGSIISANYVLTAAHCTDGSSPQYIQIRSGTSKLESGGTSTKVSSIAQNPKFDYFELDYDVSVLKLAQPLTLGTNQQAVTLRTKEAAAGETAQVSGWGTTTEGGSLPSNLQAVQVPIVDRQECNDAYDGDVSDRMICAGVAGKDSCQGDSGGAITINGTQVGIVSWGYGCAEEGYPGVYSNVAALADYIIANTNNETKWA